MTATEQTRAKAEQQARDMAEENPTRKELVDKLEALVAEYNSTTIDAANFFEALKAFVADMNEEQRRAWREGLTEPELAVFDRLTKPAPKLTKAQEIEVEAVAKGAFAEAAGRTAPLTALGAEPADAGCRAVRDQGETRSTARDAIS